MIYNHNSGSLVYYMQLHNNICNNICNCKVTFVIQYKFNVSVSSALASINTLCTLLAFSSLTTVKVTESRSDTNLKPAMEADAT